MTLATRIDRLEERTLPAAACHPVIFYEGRDTAESARARYEAAGHVIRPDDLVVFIRKFVGEE